MPLTIQGARISPVAARHACLDQLAGPGNPARRLLVGPAKYLIGRLFYTGAIGRTWGQITKVGGEMARTHHAVPCQPAIYLRERILGCGPCQDLFLCGHHAVVVVFTHANPCKASCLIVHPGC